MSGVYKHASYEFQVIKEIGGGGFGKVFSVSLPTCDYKYALKIFAPIREIAEASCLSDGELLERFHQEIWYQISCRHDNIATICVFQDSDHPFFVMDIADYDLKTAIDENILSTSEKIKAILDVMNGLEYLHSKEWFHRDIKPANILCFNGTYKLSDFGLIKNAGNAKNPKDVMSAIGLRLGTNGYMAPEVMEACIYSKLSDIYALGVVIAQLNIPGFDVIVDNCTKYIPRQRYQSISSLRDAVLKEIENA